MFETGARRLRALRWSSRAPRIAVTAAGTVIALTGVRALVAGPAEPVRAAATAPASALEPQALAEAFARDYLTWADTAQTSAITLSSYGPDIVPPSPPSGLEQSVLWTSVAGIDRHPGGAQTVTVVADTNRGRYALAVAVARRAPASFQVVGQPAIVGALAAVTRRAPRAAERELDDAALRAVAGRAVRNYLSHDREDLAADLATNAIVVLPEQRLRVRAVDAITWVRGRRRVAVTVRAVDRSRVEMTLRYELAVTRSAGRWLVRAIHTNPEVQ